MIHPDAARIRQRCACIRDEFIAMSTVDATLPECAGLPIYEHTQGWVNVCYELGDVAIVRLNARDPHLPKFAREAAVFNDPRVRRVAPVPRVIAHDAARWEYPMLVTSRLPGDNLEHHWPTLSTSQRHALATHAGELLAALHTVHSPDGFGDPHAPHTISWSERVLSEARRHGQDMLVCGVCDEVLVDDMLALMTTCTHELDEVQTPALVHRDYHFGNLLFEQDRITGVLDFEWCEYGDARRDLMKWSDIEHLYPGSEGFRQGYGAHAWRGLDEEPVGVLYDLLGGMEMSVVARCFFGADDAARYRAELDVLLERARQRV